MKARNRIKVVLAEKNVQSKQLGQMVGVSRTTISKWVNNKQQPTLNHLYEIADALEVNICELLVNNANKELNE